MAIIGSFGNFNRMNSGVFPVYSATFIPLLHLFHNIYQSACQLLFAGFQLGKMGTFLCPRDQQKLFSVGTRNMPTLR